MALDIKKIRNILQTDIQERILNILTSVFSCIIHGINYTLLMILHSTQGNSKSASGVW